MSALSDCRLELQTALCSIGFLRRDLTNAALFVSDYPRRAAGAEGAAARLSLLGYHSNERNGLLYISPDRRRLARMIPPATPAARALCERERPLYSIALRLIRAEVPLAFQPLEPLYMTLNLLEANEFERLYNLLGPALAECLRLKSPLPSAAGYFILDKIKGEEII